MARGGRTGWNQKEESADQAGGGEARLQEGDFRCDGVELGKRVALGRMRA